jgi:hypothetical protein
MIKFFKFINKIKIKFRYQNFYLIKFKMVIKKYLLIIFFFSHRNIVKI